MAIVHGKGGSATFTGLTLTGVTSWSFSSTAELAPITAMGATWESTLEGMTSFTATIEALTYHTVDTVAVIGDSAVLSLNIVSGGTDEIVATNATLTSLTETVSIDAAGTTSYTFACDAATLVYPA